MLNERAERADDLLGRLRRREMTELDDARDWISRHAHATFACAYMDDATESARADMALGRLVASRPLSVTVRPKNPDVTAREAPMDDAEHLGIRDMLLALQFLG